ncbi:hypothetical protein D3C81_2094370 [compost metagenome]
MLFKRNKHEIPTPHKLENKTFFLFEINDMSITIMNDSPVSEVIINPPLNTGGHPSEGSRGNKRSGLTSFKAKIENSTTLKRINGPIISLQRATI